MSAASDPAPTVDARVVAVAADAAHAFSKPVRASVRLLAGLGVEGDTHLGVTVQHRSRVKRDPTQPNLRQVHLIQGELFDELRRAGFEIGPGEIGENITTAGIDLLALPRGTRLQLGDAALIEITGLRNPCVQLDRFRAGLTAAALEHGDDGRLIRKAGVMAIVLGDGTVRAGDAIRVELPAGPQRALEPV